MEETPGIVSHLSTVSDLILIKLTTTQKWDKLNVWICHTAMMALDTSVTPIRDTPVAFSSLHFAKTQIVTNIQGVFRANTNVEF